MVDIRNDGVGSPMVWISGIYSSENGTIIGSGSTRAEALSEAIEAVQQALNELKSLRLEEQAK